MSNTIIKDFKYLIIICVIFCGLLLTGWYGFFLALQGSGQSFLDFLYLSLQLFVLQSGAEVPINNYYLQFARFFAPVLTLSVFALAIVLLIEQIQKFRLKSMKNHSIVCGLGYLGLEIARHYAKEKKDVIVIEIDPENPNIKAIRDEEIPIIIGDATQKKILEMVRIKEAQDIYLVTGNDSTNAEIAVNCWDIFDKSGKKHLCGHIHFENKDLWQAFATHISASCTPAASQSMLMDFFNLYQIAGFCMLTQHRPFHVEEIRSGSVNILIIGLGRLGENLLVRIVKMWKNAENEGQKIHVTCVDIDGARKKNAILWKYRDIREWCDLKIISIDLTSQDFLQSEILSENWHLGTYSRAYICVHSSSISATTALRLSNNPRYKRTEIIVRATYGDGITKIFDRLHQKNSINNIHMFPIISNRCCLDMIVHGVHLLEKVYIRDKIAQALHENYRKMRFMEGAIQGTDPALEPWDVLREDLRESNRQQADFIKEQFKTMNIGLTILPEWSEPLFCFSPDEIERLAKAEHQRWMKEKIDAGWKYGPIKDYNLKVTPYLVDYEKLDDEVKQRDRIPFISIPSVLAEFDLKIVRLSPCDR